MRKHFNTDRALSTAIPAQRSACKRKSTRGVVGLCAFTGLQAGAGEPQENDMSDRDEAGRFAPGNRFWEARSSHGAKPKFDNPGDLWDACVEYFEWNEDNPLYETKGFAFQGVVTKEEFPKMRAMTIGGLCLFLDVTRKTWDEWRKTRPDLCDIITRAEAVIFKQKFEGASADLLNGNIIARELGLADKQDHQSSDGSMTPKDGSSALDRINSRLDSILAANPAINDSEGSE